MTAAAFEELRRELRAIEDLESAAAVLEWDQQTYMPDQGATARARQIALLGEVAHARRTSPRMRELMDGLSSMREEEGVDGAIYRRARREWERATRVPGELVRTIREHTAATYVAWTKARPKSDFATMRPYLEKTLELSRRWSDCFSAKDHVADPLIDAQDPGMSAATVRALFAELREELVPIVQSILERPAPDDAFLNRHYPTDQQRAFTESVSKMLGYDFERGRQDETHHPFMIRFSAGDVRITTRFREREPMEALFGTIHETGHALYEMHVDPDFDGTPLGHGTSAGVHESQSRLWENLVARSLPFWRHLYPALVDAFPEQLGDTDVETFHRAINKVERSLVRTSADECTYNLHVMLRFDLELAMLEGELRVADLPDAWNGRLQSDLGVRPENDAEGCMQDVHWYCTTIGGHFQGYTLGNLMSAQFFAAAVDALGDVDAAIEKGDFAPLRGWLAENVYQHGSRYLPEELVERATGEPLSIDPFVSYLKNKFGPLYGL